MDALIVYDSSYGNTEQVAHAIAQGLGEHYSVRVVAAAQAALLAGEAAQLLIVGGPTQERHLSPGLRAMLEGLPRRSLQGVQAVTFDTRYRMARSLSGSAAREAARRLRRTGCRLAAPPESFFMGKDVPPEGQKRRHALERLEPGELERARQWARRLALETAAVRS